jgi:hypothetical protein
MFEHSPYAFLPWNAMTDRERMVWATTYARYAPDDPDHAATMADATVEDLRGLNLDPNSALDPEYEAARAGCEVDFEHFQPWYEIAWRIRHFHERPKQAPSPVQVREAFDRFAEVYGEFH